LNPGAIAIDRQQHVYITDGETGLVQKFSSDGQFLRAWSTDAAGTVQFGIPRGVAADAENNVYVSSVDLSGDTFTNGRVTKLSSLWEVLAVWK
jgi:hypothetical protein